MSDPSDHVRRLDKLATEGRKALLDHKVPVAVVDQLTHTALAYWHTQLLASWVYDGQTAKWLNQTAKQAMKS